MKWTPKFRQELNIKLIANEFGTAPDSFLLVLRKFCCRCSNECILPISQWIPEGIRIFRRNTFQLLTSERFLLLYLRIARMMNVSSVCWSSFWSPQDHILRYAILPLSLYHTHSKNQNEIIIKYIDKSYYTWYNKIDQMEPLMLTKLPWIH